MPDDICISKKGLVSTQYTGKKWSSDKFESGSTAAAALKLVTPTEAKIISGKNAREWLGLLGVTKKKLSCHSMETFIP